MSGPLGKDPSKRARRNKVMAQKVIQISPTEQPSLPTFYVTEPDEDGNLKKKKFVWPAATKRWWAMWSESPLSQDFTDNDWSELLDTALVHARHWSGDMKAAAELRIRAAKFGSTPEDRARLKIVFAQADEADDRVERRRAGAAGAETKKRYRDLRAVD